MRFVCISPRCLAYFLGAAGMLWATASQAGPMVTVRTIGNPIWAPVDFHLFTAPANATPQDLAFFVDTVRSVFPAPHYLLTNHIIPIPPSAPPYDTEIGDRIAALGYPEKAVFSPADFAGTPNGVYLTYMIIPQPGTTGSSPDFSSGPIIPESLFPLETSEQTFRNGLPFDQDGTVQIPKLSDFGFAVDGSSHRPEIWEDDFTFAPPGLSAIAGEYVYHVTLRDASGNGYDVDAEFQVATPEPSSAMIFSTGGVLLIAYGWQRCVRSTKVKLGKRMCPLG